MHCRETGKCRREDNGFTLIELIVSLALLGILSAVLGMGVVGALNVYSVSEENVQIAQQSQLALARIDRELRELTAVINHEDPTFIIYRNLRGSTGIHAIQFDSANSRIVLYSDLASGTTDLDSPSVTPDILLQEISAFSLSYLQGTDTWDGIHDRFLSHIAVSLTMNRSGSIATNNEVFTSLIYLRNTINYGGATPPVEPPEPQSMAKYGGTYNCFITSCLNDGSFNAGADESALRSLSLSAILVVLCVGLGLSAANSKNGRPCQPQDHRGISGSALIAVIVAIVLFSTVAAALLPLVGSSGHQSVARDQADKAYLMAESGFRYAASAYINQASDAARLQALDDLHKSLFQTNQGNFSLRLFSFFFRVSSAVSAGTTNQLVVSIPGDMPPDLATAAQADNTFFNGLKLRVGDVTYAVSSSSFHAAPATDAITFTLQDTISQTVAVDTPVYPVADVTASQTLNSGDTLSYESSDAKLFPDHNGLIQVADRNLSYRFNNKASNQFEDVRDLNDSSPVEIHSGDEILLRRQVRLESTGNFGSGGFAVSRTVTYDTPLFFGAETEQRRTFQDSFDNADLSANWTTGSGSHAIENVGVNPRLQVTSTASAPSSPWASLIALTSSDANETLRKSYQSSGNFLSYDAQVKIGFLDDPTTLNASDNDYYFASGISFRLDENGNSYGISIMRGNQNLTPPYDYIENDLVPTATINKMAIVLWRQVDDAYNSNWLAYKDIDGWPVQDTTLTVRIKEAVVLSFENGTTVPIEKGNVILGQDSGARGRVIQGPILANGTTWATGATGYLLLNSVSGDFQANEDILVVGRGVLATVQSYSNQRTNIIRIYYSTPDTSICGSGDESPFPGSDLLCYPLGTSPLVWPPDLKYDGELSWPAAEDYFHLIQWDGVNTAGESNLAVVDSDVEPDAIILHHHNSLQTPESSYPSTRPELGLHSYGRGATNVYFDDFGIQLTIRVSAVIPTPVQQ